MNPQNIGAGDLVMIVRPKRCGCSENVGLPFRVNGVERSCLQGCCTNCGSTTFPEGTLVAFSDDYTYCAEVSRLKKIPPLGELEGQTQKEDIREPRETDVPPPDTCRHTAAN